MKILVDGSLIDESRPAISVSDRAFLYGDAVFETFRSYKGKVPFIDRHIRRLKQSLVSLRINYNVTENEILSAIATLLKTNKLEDAVIKVTVSRGSSERAVAVSGMEIPRIIISASDRRFYPEKMYAEGIKLFVSSIRRIPSVSLPSGIKSHNYLNQVLARIEADENGADDALLKNVRGFISETSSANIFFVKKGLICTPSKDCDILEGVTRGIIMEIADEEGIKIKEGRYFFNGIVRADECFITNSVAEVIPVAKIDHYKIGGSIPGPLTRRMFKKYRQRVYAG